MESKKVLQPIKIKEVSVPSRIFLAPINTGYSHNGFPTNEFFSFYKKRSCKYIGICCIGNISVSNRYVTNDSTLYINNKNIDIYKTITETIKINGSIPGIQLACKYSKIPSMREWVSDNPLEYIERAITEINNIPERNIQKIQDDFLFACEYAVKSGFMHIQLHAAHGYFLSQLISKNFNKRKDIYSSDNLYIIETISNKIKKNFPQIILDIRLSFYEETWNNKEEELYKENLISKLAKMPFDIISISNGIYNINKHMIYPQKDIGTSGYFSMGRHYSNKYPNIVWNIAGNLDSLDRMEDNYENNLTFSVGRQLICDPNYIEKYISQNQKNIQYCSRCGKCHYYSNNMHNINCLSY